MKSGSRSTGHLSAETGSPKEIAEIRHLIQRGRLRWRRLTLLRDAGAFLTPPLLFLWLTLRVDTVVHLPTWARVTASACLLAGVTTFLYRLILAWRKHRYTHDQVALAIEQRAAGQLQNRLINAVQLARNGSGVTATATAAVVRENCRVLVQSSLPRSISGWPAAIATTATFLALALGTTYWFLDRENFANAAARIFLPLADIKPLYRTSLAVSPEEMTAKPGKDVTIKITIKGELPDELLILGKAGDVPFSQSIAVEDGKHHIRYTFKTVRHSMLYSVHGGDFTTTTCRIHVPLSLELARFTASLQYPGYTHLPERSFVSAAGDVEALKGTRAQFSFTTNRTSEHAWMIPKPVGRDTTAQNPAMETMQQPNDLPDETDRIPLKKIGPATFSGNLQINRTSAYVLELHDGHSNIFTTRPYTLAASEDRPPRVQLHGIKPDADVLIDDVLPLTISARDDYGLNEVALCYRRADTTSRQESWHAVATWTVEGNATEFNQDYPLPIESMDLLEGEMVELAVRGRDHDPGKQDQWSWGSNYALKITGVGTALQLQYARIIKSEHDLRRLIAASQQQVTAASKWITRIGKTTSLSRDAQRPPDGRLADLEQQVQDQSEIRQVASTTAEEMADEVSTLRTTLGMLADTELVRCIRMLESVSTKETAQDRRTVLTDVRLTQRRIIRTLESILDRYVAFRLDWELAHMVSYTRMLAERQHRMAEKSLSHAILPTEIIGATRPGTASRRQAHLLQMAGLAQTAFVRMTEHPDVVATPLSEAFQAAASTFDSSGLKSRMQEAHDFLSEAAWPDAAPLQRAASENLLAIHEDLRKAQILAARQAIASIQELSQENLEAQSAIQQLKPGTAEALAQLDAEGLDFKEVIHLRKRANQLRRKAHQKTPDSFFGHEYDLAAWIHDPKKKPTGRQQVDIIQLAEQPGSQWSSPKQSARRGERITGHPQEDVGDLVGDLLDEADELRSDYESYYLMSDARLNDPGQISKQAGDISHMQGAAVTGNIKPPTNNFAGASRTGRQGGRAFGYSLGTESINRRGRDQVQEGLEEVAQQKGRKIETLSANPQQDTSTGIGGKLVKREESFNTKDAGRWKDSMAKQLQAAKGRHRIVERQGAPLDARVAEQMHDTQSRYDQVIERIKALKKELNRLYLPSDHLDELLKKMQANFEQLSHVPDPEVFREQAELLDQLAGAVIVFGRPESVYDQSLSRQQVVRGWILDQPARPTSPNYEAAVTRYYEKLAGLGGGPPGISLTE